MEKLYISDFAKKRLPWIAAGSAVGAIYAECLIRYGLVNSDVWWYLKFGEVIWTQGIPKTELFSWSVHGKPVVMQEWLFQAVLYPFYRIGDLNGIRVFFSAFFAGITLVLWRIAKSVKPDALGALALTAAFLCMFVGLTPRAQLYDYLVWGVFLHACATGKKLWLLPLLTIIWANAHASVIMAPLTVWLAAALPPVESEKLAWKPDRKKLLVVAATVTAATLCTPHGVQLWDYAVKAVSDPAFAEHMGEWQPAPFYKPFFRLTLLLVLVTAVWRLIFIKEKVSLYLAVVFAAALVSGIAQIRYLPYTGIALAVLVGAGKETGNKTPARALLVLAAGLVAAVLSIASFGQIAGSTEELARLQKSPVDAACYLKSHGYERTLNWFNWGGYLIYADVPVFVDGRSEVYHWDSDVFMDYMLKFKNLEIDYLADKYNPDGTVVPGGSAHDRYFKLLPGWEEVYRDDVAVVYRRSGVP